MGITYRRIKASDCATITALAVRALTPAQDVPLRIDPAKVMHMVSGFAASPEHYNMAAFEDGVAVGGICAYVVDSPIFERGEAHVAMCFAEKPGTGVSLIAAMLKEFEENPFIMRVCWMMNEPSEDAVALRFGEMLKRRYKFDGKHDNLVRYMRAGN